MNKLLAEEMLIRWRRLAQVDISEMQADTAIVELSRAVQLLLDEDLELRRHCDLLRRALQYASETNTNLTKLLAYFAPARPEGETQ